ncbi:translocation/assembly module TamB domain-containing protein [bacterium]|nr:translocation/assembly module TamB domain-containing protein [bacterium]
MHGICRISKVSGDIRSHLVLNDVYIYYDLVSMTRKEPVFYAEKIDLKYSLFEILGDDKTSLTMDIEKSLTRIIFDKDGWNLVKLLKKKNSNLSHISSKFNFKDSKIVFVENRNSQKKEIYFKKVSGFVKNSEKTLEIHLKGFDEFSADSSVTYDQISREKSHKFDLSVKNGILKQYGNYIFGVSPEKASFRSGKFDFSMNIDSSFYDRDIGGDIKLMDAVMYIPKLGETKVNAEVKIEKDTNKITSGTVEYGKNKIDIIDGEFDSEEMTVNFTGKDLMVEEFPFVKLHDFKTIDSIKGKLKYGGGKLNILSSIFIKRFEFMLNDFPGDLLLSDIHCDVELINDFIDLKSVEFFFRYSIFPLLFKFHIAGQIPESNVMLSQIKGWFELLKTPLKFKLYNLNKKLSIISDNLDMQQNSLIIEYGGEFVRHYANLKVKLTFREFLHSLRFSCCDQDYNEYNISKVIANNVGLGGEVEIRYMNDFHSRGIDFGKPEFSVYSKEIVLLKLGLTIRELLMRVKKYNKSIVFLPGKFIFHGKKINYNGKIERSGKDDYYYFSFKCDNIDKSILREYLPEYADYIDTSIDFSVVVDYSGTLENGKVKIKILMDKPLIKGFFHTDQILINIAQKGVFDFKLESIRVNGSKDADFSLKLDVDESDFLHATGGTGSVVFKKKRKSKLDNEFLSKVDHFEGKFTFQDGNFLFEKTNLGLNIDKVGALTVETAGFLKLDSKNKYSFEFSGKGKKNISGISADIMNNDGKNIGFSFKASGNEKKITTKGNVKLQNEKNKVIGSTDFEIKKSKIVFKNMIFNKMNIPALFSLDFDKFLKFNVKLKSFKLENLQKIYPEMFPFILKGKVSGHIDYNFTKSSLNLTGKNIIVGMNSYDNVHVDMDVFLDKIKMRSFIAQSKNSFIIGRTVGDVLEMKVKQLMFSEMFNIESGILRIGKSHGSKIGFPIEGENLVLKFKNREFKVTKLLGMALKKDDSIALKNTVVVVEGNRLIINGIVGKDRVNIDAKMDKNSFSLKELTGLKKLKGKLKIWGRFDITGKFPEVKYTTNMKWKTEGLKIGNSKKISLKGKLKSKGDKFKIYDSEFNMYGNKGIIEGQFDFKNRNQLERVVMSINVPKVEFNPDVEKLFSNFGIPLPIKKARGDLKFGVIWNSETENLLHGSIRINDLVLKGIVENRTRLKIPPGWNLNIKVDFADNITIETSRMHVFMNGDLVIKGKNGQGWLSGRMKMQKKSKFYYINNEFEIISGYYNFFNLESSLDTTEKNFKNSKKLKNTKKMVESKYSRNVEFKEYIYKDTKKKVLDFEDNFLYIKSYTKIGRYIIYIEVSKREEKAETRLYSTPSLTQREIIAILLTGNDTLVSSGRISSDDVYNDDKIINIIGSDIQNQFLYKMSGGLRKKLKFDEFRVYSDLRDDSGLPSTKLSIGKYVSPKTMLLYKKSFSDSDKDFLGLDYDLNKNLKLNSEIGTQGDEVKFGIQFDKTFK